MFLQTITYWYLVTQPLSTNIIMQIFFWTELFLSIKIKKISPHNFCFTKYLSSQKSKNDSKCSNKHVGPVGGDKIYINDTSNTDWSEEPNSYFCFLITSSLISFATVYSIQQTHGEHNLLLILL